MKTDSAPRSATSPRPDAPPSTEPTALDKAPALDKKAPTPDNAPDAPGALVVQARYRPLPTRTRVGFIIAIAAAAIVFLSAVHTILRPFIWAAVIAYILNPTVKALCYRLRVKRGVAVAAVMAVLLALVAGGLTAVVPALRSDLAALTASFTTLDNYLTTYLPNAGTVNVVGIQVQVPQLVQNAQGAINDSPRAVLHSGFSVATGAVETLLRMLTFIITTVYLLLDGPRLSAWFAAKVPDGQREETVLVARRIGEVLSEYLRAEVILILLMSTLSLIALTALGVRFALLLAPIVGFLEIFPIVGPFVAIALVTIVALVSPPIFGLSPVGHAVVVALIFFVLRQLEDYLVIPNVVGHAVKLHPVLILFALLSGATLGGILGMFIAVPVTGALKVLGSHVYDRLVA